MCKREGHTPWKGEATPNGRERPHPTEGGVTVHCRVYHTFDGISVEDIGRDVGVSEGSKNAMLENIDASSQ